MPSSGLVLEHTQHTEEGHPGGGCHLATVGNEAGLVAASARISCPLARGYLTVSVQDLMAADTAFGRAVISVLPDLGTSWARWIRRVGGMKPRWLLRRIY